MLNALSTARNQSGIMVSAYEKSTASTGAAGFQVQASPCITLTFAQPLCPLAGMLQQRRTQIHDLHRFELREAVAEKFQVAAGAAAQLDHPAA